MKINGFLGGTELRFAVQTLKKIFLDQELGLAHIVSGIFLYKRWKCLLAWTEVRFAVQTIKKERKKTEKFA